MPKLKIPSALRIPSVTEYHVHTTSQDKNYITKNLWKLTKQELTDLVQVGEVLIFRSHLDEQGTLLKCSDVENYKEVVIYTEVQRENNPQNLEYTAQEALSYMTDIQIMEEETNLSINK